jgi:site-specific DNA-cytosine methylase
MMAVRPPCYWDGGQTADTLDVSGLVKRQTMPERRRFQAVIVQDAEGRQRLRRLTPLECERLQGFPDGWTEGHADATRYRMLGNAVTVPVAEWIGRRIIAAHGHGREDCNGENHI